MQNDSIQMRMAVQMFIDFLLEHQEELEKEVTEKHKQEARDSLARINKERAQNRLESENDTTND